MLTKIRETQKQYLLSVLLVNLMSPKTWKKGLVRLPNRHDNYYQKLRLGNLTRCYLAHRLDKYLKVEAGVEVLDVTWPISSKAASRL